MMSQPGESSQEQDKGPDLHLPEVHAALERYWRRNLQIMWALLFVWAIAGLGCGVLFADWLNQFQIGGIPLGFWFAQQGSIYVFIILTFVYAFAMDRIDRRHGVDNFSTTGRSKISSETAE